MLIQYICTKKYAGLLDFLNDSNDEHYIVQKQEGTYQLKEWLMATGRMRFITEFFLDRAAFTEDDEDFVEGIKSLKIMTKTRISVLIPGCGNDTLVTSLIEAGIGNIATAGELEELKKQVQACLSPDGMRRGNIPSEDSVYRFNKDVIHIGFCGSRNKIGVTNTALAFGKWAVLKGAQAYVVTSEASLLRNYLGIDTQDLGNCWNWDGVTVSDTAPSSDIKPDKTGGTIFVIYDGKVSGTIDLNAVLLGWKPTEYEYTKQALTKAAYWLINFAEDSEDINVDIAEIAKNIGEATNQTIHYSLLGWCPSPADPKGHAKAFRELLSAWIL